MDKSDVLFMSATATFIRCAQEYVVKLRTLINTDVTSGAVRRRAIEADAKVQECIEAIKPLTVE